MKQAFPLQSWAESDGVDGMDGWIATATAPATEILGKVAGVYEYKEQCAEVLRR